MTPEEYFSLEVLKPFVATVMKKQIPVRAECMKEPGEIESLEGKTKYDAGDYIITGVKGEKYAVGKEYFEKNYIPVTGGEPGSKSLYSKKPVPVKALPILEDMEVPVGYQASPIHGRAGTPGREPDMLIEYEPGNYGVVAMNIFKETYNISPQYNKLIEEIQKILFNESAPELARDSANNCGVSLERER